MSRVTTVVVTYEIDLSCRAEVVTDMRAGCVAAGGGRFEPVRMSNHEGPKGACADVAIGVYDHMVLSTTLTNWLESFRKRKGRVLNVRVIVHKEWEAPKYYKLWPEEDLDGS